MKPVELASISLKILGIYSFFQAIPVIGNLFTMGSIATLKSFNPEMNMVVAISGIILPLILYLTFGFFLIFKSDRIAERLTQTMNYEKNIQTLNSGSFQAVAFSIVGLIIIIFAIPEVMRFFLKLSQHRVGVESHLMGRIPGDVKIYGILAFVKMLIGILLFMGSSKLSSFWHKFLNRINYEKSFK